MIFDVLKDWKESKQFRLIGWLGILLLTIKLVMLFGIPIIPHAIEDWYIAKHIAEGSGYSLSNGSTALKTPVYPLFLSLPAFIGEFGKIFACGLQHILWSRLCVLSICIGINCTDSSSLHPILVLG